jgi:putative FmdB family regulatory protein
VPLYAFRCPSCGGQDELFCSYQEIPGQKCSACGAGTEKIISGVRLAGPTETKPVKVGGNTFTTADQFARWENSPAAAGLEVVSSKDAVVRRKVDKHRAGIEAKARRAGYKDERHRIREVRKEQRMLQERK